MASQAEDRERRKNEEKKYGEQEMKFSLTCLALKGSKRGERRKNHFVPLSYMEKSISDMSKQDKPAELSYQKNPSK